MSFYLKQTEQVDFFYFKETGNDKITFQAPLNILDFLTYVQVSLTMKKLVILTDDLNYIENINLNELKRSHFLIHDNKFIFLNFSLKNKILNLCEESLTIENYQDVEALTRQNQSKIFQVTD